jgi:hypothetical protein
MAEIGLNVLMNSALLAGFRYGNHEGLSGSREKIETIVLEGLSTSSLLRMLGSG